MFAEYDHLPLFAYAIQQEQEEQKKPLRPQTTFPFVMYTAKGKLILNPTVKLNGQRITLENNQCLADYSDCNNPMLTVYDTKAEDLITLLWIDYKNDKRKYEQSYRVLADNQVQYIDRIKPCRKAKQTPASVTFTSITNEDTTSFDTDPEATTEEPITDKQEQEKQNSIPQRKISFTHELPHPYLTKSELTPTERQELLDEYITKGRSLILEGDRGLIDSHIRRENNLGQFFTPSKVVKVLTQALGIAYHPGWEDSWLEPLPRKAVDFSGCGNGRLFQYLPENWTLHGADIDTFAVQAARLIYPNANILQTNFVNFNFPKKTDSKPYHLAILNPPFSLRLNTKTKSNLNCAEWGIWGQSTSLNSHIAALEMALRIAHTVAIILPTTALQGENLTAINTVLEKTTETYHEILRIDLPPEAFESEGTKWPCTILIYSTYRTSSTTTHNVCNDWNEVETCLDAHVQNLKSEYDRYNKFDCYKYFALAFHFSNLDHPSTNKLSLSDFLPNTTEKKCFAKREIKHDSETPAIRLCLNGRANKINLKANNLVARLLIEQAKLHHGYLTTNGYEPNSRLDWLCDLVRNAGHAYEQIPLICKALKKADSDISITIDEQLIRFAKKLDKRTSIELNPHAQWIKNSDEGSTWTKHYAEDIECVDHPAYDIICSRYQYFKRNTDALGQGLIIKKWDKTQKKHIEHSYPPIPIYDFSQKDIVRSLGRRAIIYSAKQGLAKTRFSIGAVLASGTTKAVWILESRLINEFKIELEKLELLEHFHHIKTKSDLKKLKLINVISYNRLWTSVPGKSRKKDQEKDTWGEGASYAAALAKHRITVVIDEAHKIKSEEPKQAKAARYLCKRAKRVILMTGTVIQSYARNILGLTNAAWGEGSSINPYGYGKYGIRPMEGNYSIVTEKDARKYRPALIKGVTNFIDTYVRVEWYTSQFASTASGGRKSREVPKIKNLNLWNSFKQSKIIRRVPNEPEVRMSGITTPEAKPQYIPVTPIKNHQNYYRLVLDHFAQIWEERLKKEKRDQIITPNSHILPELNALRFASSAPFLDHKWIEDSPILKNNRYMEPTAVMYEALMLINDWVSTGDKVIIGSEKPSVLKYLSDLLTQLPKHIKDSDPIPYVLALDENIDNRNIAIEQAKNDPDIPVLLITIGKGKEGLNLPQFSRLLTLDFGWKPGDLDQFRHRILRPGQQQDCQIVHLFHSSMIDEYMKQLCDAKEDAINENIDGQESTYNYKKWQDHRTFALNMLSSLGYDFATKELLIMHKNQSPIA